MIRLLVTLTEPALMFREEVAVFAVTVVATEVLAPIVSVPIVVVPPSPANTRDLSDHLGLPVQVGYLGSCASGRIEDLRAAAQVLRGRQVHPGFQLHVVPTSQEIMRAAAAEGLLTDLIAAGAFISSPSCDYCFGRIGVMTAGQRAVST